MAKRIVSLLCALAMLATMIVVSAFSASAVTVTEKVFSSGYTNTTAKYQYQDVIDTTLANVTPDYGVVVKTEHQKATITATDSKTYDLGAKWSASFMAWYRSDNYRGYGEVNIGDLTIRVDREEANGDALSNYNADTANVRVSVKFDGGLLEDYGLLASSSMTTNDKAAFTSIADYIPDGQTKKWVGSTSSLTRRCVLVNVSYDESQTHNLSVAVYTKQSDDAGYTKWLAGGDYDVADGSFASAVPVSATAGNLVGTWSTELFLGRFTLTYEAALPFVTLDGNGGTFDETQAFLDDAGHPTSLPTTATADKRHCAFAGWYTAAEGGTEVTTSSVLTTGSTIYAHWTALPNQMADFAMDRTQSYNTSNAATNYSIRYLNAELWHYAISTNGDATKNYTVGTIGTYTMSGFDVTAELWEKGLTNNPDSQGGATDTFEFTFGKLIITFRKANAANGSGNFVITATYDGAPITLTGSSAVSTYDGTLTTLNAAGAPMLTSANRENYVYVYGAAYTDRKAALTAAGGNGAGSRAPTDDYPIRIVFANDTLTLTTPTTAPTWSVTGTIPGATFNDAEVKVMVKNGNQNISNVICANFYGTYTPATTPAVPTAAQPELSTELAVNFFYPTAALTDNNLTAADLTADFTCAGCEPQTGVALTTTSLGGVDGFFATFANIKPSSYAEDITVTLKNGADTVSTFTYTMKDYCLHMLANANASAELKTLCMDILNYGDAVRTLTGGTAAAILGEDTAAYSSLASANVDVDGFADPYAEGEGAAFTSAALNLRDKVSLVMKIAKANVTASKSDLSLVCAVAGGDTYTLIDNAVVDDGTNYVFTIPVGLTYAASDCAIVLKNAGVDLTKTYHLTIASLCKYYVGNGYGELGQAILKVAASAQAYGATL